MVSLVPFTFSNFLIFVFFCLFAFKTWNEDVETFKFLGNVPSKWYSVRISSRLPEDHCRLLWGQKDAILFWNIKSEKSTVPVIDNVASILYNINLKSIHRVAAIHLHFKMLTT